MCSDLLKRAFRKPLPGGCLIDFNESTVNFASWEGSRRYHIVRIATMREIATSVAKILLLAMMLFFSGPLLGSLDVDGDGLPDVPVVVTGCDYHLSETAESTLPTGIDPSIESSVSNDPELKHGRINVYLPRTASDSVKPLRC